MSTTHSEQHPLSLSIVLHLLPGILIGAIFFLLAPIAQRNGLPPVWAHGIADLVVLVPFVFGLLYYEGYKKNGRLSLEGVVLYREPIPWWQYLIFVPLLLAAGALIPLLEPVSNTIFQELFSWWPAMYNLLPDLSLYSRPILVSTLIFQFLVIAIIAPITEEIYFRGYLLPRLSRFGFWAAPIHAALFALFHVWTPWLAVARAVGLIPFTLIVQWKRNIYIAIIMHIIINLLDLTTGVMLLLSWSGR
ncbi:MAG TPA: CPBP family intramembrane glutamic endopeptidase [Anaerolineales bacterium]|nr:CPBP family intramembrane glutamic endopeptidase [Anaerolineales bacterium]